MNFQGYTSRASFKKNLCNLHMVTENMLIRIVKFVFRIAERKLNLIEKQFNN